MKYYIDANIFIYSTNYQDLRHISSKKILEEIIVGELNGFTSVETFEEIIHYGKKTKVTPITLALCKKLLKIPLQVIPFTNSILSVYLRLVGKYEKSKIDSRDLVHVASALKSDVKAIISADRDFDKIKEIKRIDPKEFLG